MLPDEDRCTESFVGLVRYLRELTRLRSKLVRTWHQLESVLWFEDLRHNPHIECVLADDCTVSEEDTEPAWLEVAPGPEPPAPEPPEAFRDLIDPETPYTDDETEPQLCLKDPGCGIVSAGSPEQSAAIATAGREPQGSTSTTDSGNLSSSTTYPPTPGHAGADSEPPEWRDYIKRQWRPWSQRHRLWRQAQEVYAKLYRIHNLLRQSREDWEVVIGIGLLRACIKTDQVWRSGRSGSSRG